MKFEEILIESATAALGYQNPETGSMPAGHNGPYKDPETPVRNTAHWLIIFLKAYELSSSTHFLKAGQRAAEYLCSPESRPMNGAFFHRTNPDKDNSNGLIGQAWTIEALLYASDVLQDKNLLGIAEEVFLMHPFDESEGLWDRLSVEGTSPGRDETFNHQLWFGAIGLQIGNRHPVIESRCRLFLDKLPGHLRIYSSGLIVHLLHKSGWKPLAKRIKQYLLPGENERQAVIKAVGYQLFNLYAFAMIKQLCPDYGLFKSSKFQKTLSFAFSKEFEARITHNPYGYPYNPPGFEMAYVRWAFDPDSYNEQVKWIEKQIEICYNKKTHLMDRNSLDAWTQSARLYEGVRWLDSYKSKQVLTANAG